MDNLIIAFIGGIFVGLGAGVLLVTEYGIPPRKYSGYQPHKATGKPTGPPNEGSGGRKSYPPNYMGSINPTVSTGSDIHGTKPRRN